MKKMCLWTGEGRMESDLYLYFLLFYCNTGLQIVKCCSATAEVVALSALLTDVSVPKV